MPDDANDEPLAGDDTPDDTDDTGDTDVTTDAGEDVGFDDVALGLPAEPYTAEQTGLMSATDILRYAMGVWWSTAGLATVAICLIYAWVNTCEMIYDLKDKPIEITSPDDLAGLRDNDFATITHPLEHDYLVVKTRGGAGFTLNPVEGYDDRLIVGRMRTKQTSRDSQIVVEDADAGSYSGRIVRRGRLGDWNHRGSRIDLVDQFEPHGISVPADAVLLVSGDVPRVSAVTVIVLSLAAIGLLVFLSRLARALSFIFNRQRLADHLNRG